MSLRRRHLWRSVTFAAGLTACLIAAALLNAASASASTPAETDVMFLFDTSGSMGPVLEEARGEIDETMSRLNAALPNVEYGVAEVRDYSPSPYTGEAAEEVEPGVPVMPWVLDQSVTSNAGAVQSAIEKLQATGGGDGPEAYGRALWETDTNPTVGWRPGARHLIVLIADQVPHDPNLDEGIAEEFWVESAPWNTGEELPGSWNIPDTQLKEGEKLQFHAVLSRLASDGKPLETVDYHDTEGDYLHYWEAWAKAAGGGAVEAGEGSKELASKLIPVVEGGATSELPACPAGDTRNADSECVPGPPSDNGLGAPTPTCADNTATLPGGITVEASCFQVAADGRLTATGHIRINGLDIVLGGSGGFTLNPKKLTLSASGEVDVYAGSLHIYHGDLSWSLKQKLELGVPSKLKIKGLPVGGDITASLTPGGVLAVANATVGKSPYKVSGTIDLKLKLDTGLELSSFKLELASDLPIKSLIVHKASLSYKHSSTGDEWQGAVEVELPGKGPTIAGSLTVTNGSISEVALNVSGINKPIGEVAFLQSLGLEVDFSPKLSATGSIGLSAGPAVDGHTAASLEGSLTADIGEPFVLQAKGTLSLVEDKLANASVKATIPGGVAFKGELTASWLILHIQGTVAGEVTSKSFEAEGGVKIEAPLVSANGDGLVNNVGIAGCASAQVGITVFGKFVGKTVTVGGAHRWSGENSVFDDSCGFSRLHSALGASSSSLPAAGTRIHVPRHVKQLNLIVSGSSGPPAVQLTEGKVSVLASPETKGAFGGTLYLALADPTDSQTDIAIPDPPPGTIVVSAAPGAPALRSVSSSLPLPKPDVKVRLRRVGPRRYALSWRARRIRGQALIFEDVDARGHSELLRTTRPRGHMSFTAVDNGGKGAHRLRIVVNEDGLPREVVSGPRFKPAPLKLSAPHVKVRLHGHDATVSWSPVKGAAGYRVSVSTSDGRHLFFARSAGARSVRLQGAAELSARVQAVGPALEMGRPGTAKASTRRRRPRSGKRHHAKRRGHHAKRRGHHAKRRGHHAKRQGHHAKRRG